MSSRNLLVLFFLFVFSLCFAADCTYRDSKGTLYDWTGARDPKRDYLFEENNYDYFVNFCGALNDHPECGPDTVVCQKVVGSSIWSSLGTYDTQTAGDLDTDQPGFFLFFTNGSSTSCGAEPREVKIEMLCDYDAVEPTLVNIEEETFCDYEMTVRSRFGCPTNCPRGFLGSNCSECIPGYYGPNCLQCPSCYFGECDDTKEGNGSCICQAGWAGPDCSLCLDCGYTSSDGKFVYDLKPLAGSKFDYTFKPTLSSPIVYYINVLAKTQEPCGPLASAICQRDSRIADYSLGLSNTSIIQDATVPNDGVIIQYSGGSPCWNGRSRASTIFLNCKKGAETKVEGVREPSTCVYEIYMTSQYACPSCKPGKWGPQCQDCKCFNGICSEGFEGNGTCSCLEGFEGETCDDCQRGYYGPKCTKCKCKEGKSVCSDGLQGSGKCICVSGWEGKDCDRRTSRVSVNVVAGVVGVVVGVIIVLLVIAFVFIVRLRKRLNYEQIRDKN